MSIKVIIAGGRNYITNQRDICEVIDILTDISISSGEQPEQVEVVSGGSRGADKFGESLAQILELPCTVFHAAWDIYGKSAGPKRNEQMANYADALIALPGGKGTRNMINLMKQAEKPIYIVGEHNESKTN